MSVKQNLENIREKIKSTCEKVNRNESDITIIAVTKYVSNDRAKEAISAGVTHLGENRDEGFREKWATIQEAATWHFIGTLQTRKVKNIINEIDYIHSLDRLSLAKEINNRANSEVKCFVQVNVSQEDSKHGLNPNDVLTFMKDLHSYPNIKVVGLMTMAPFTDDEAIIRECFRSLKKLQLDVQALNLTYAPCTELSMGMSNDYTIAIEEGATFIRIGSALVGEDS
ncbi:YggS family pyridoxal phosphate-dependent enzyme [Sutcliffiella cohnii]|uniref:YggS family pyridoxal phosphate-dependent enzyme n=1 Tax=Sutcliffiella cohnii TaxID=33932 RepID=UPI002E1DE903|nr:YggS family pyridoxal phosphate-dependent enzyme [Sutcliffiella cohnii]MED4015416.1 YggS family pyridoxal phosphate-dependent enzyme [Sutcliffiella cohnii]